MRNTVIAFDIDGTLITNEFGLNKEHLNLDIYSLIVLLGKMRNTTIYVWSGGGEDYANQMVAKYGLGPFVDRCFAKHSYDDAVYGKVDIAFDDESEFSIADKNIIVNYKS